MKSYNFYKLKNLDHFNLFICPFSLPSRIYGVLFHPLSARNLNATATQVRNIALVTFYNIRFKCKFLLDCY